jgi:hypothetical protein
VESGGDLTGIPWQRKTSAIAATFSGCSPCSIETVLTPSWGKRGIISLFGWYENADNTIELQINVDTGKWILKQRASGRIVAKESATRLLERDRSYPLRMTFDGSRVQLFVEDFSHPFLTLVPSASVHSGTIGIQTRDVMGSLDWIRVY